MSKNIRSTMVLNLENQVRELVGLSSGIELPEPAALFEQAQACALGTASVSNLYDLLASAGLRELANASGLEAHRCDLLDGVGSSVDVSSFLTEVGSWLADAERAGTTVVVADVLTGDGWTVDVAHGAALDAVEARLGDDVLLVAVGDREVVVDQAESSGCCEERQRQLETGMRERGLVLTRVAEDEHGDTVGPLIAAAARAGEPSLALGLARHVAPSPARAAGRVQAKARQRVGDRDQLPVVTDQ